MFTGGFGKRPKHRQFGYIPRFYDEEKEALENTLNQYKGNLSDADKVKQRISSGLRQRYVGDDSYRRQNVKKSNLRILYIVVILMFISYMILTSDKVLKMVEVFTN